ncbi:MAG: aminoglycoside phosphotransferase family protein [Dechloromonas sp.]|nr:aminoglycoside phosphotransferase family protein [Dechloromonas sp.]
MSESIPLFGFLAADHPFAPQVARFAQAIAAHPRYGQLHAAALSGRAMIHSEIKALPDPGGGWRLDRFYWSLQTWDGEPPFPFLALTLSFAAKDGALDWYEFPADAYLTTMADYFADAAAQPTRRIDVLRYVPLRRFTFRTQDASGQPVVAKFKRRSRYQSAYALLGQVHAALRPDSVGFSVAAPAGVDPARCLYFQSALPGSNLVDRLNQENLTAMLGHVGTLHRALHEASVATLPVWDRAAFMADLRRDVAWIGFMLPACRERVDALLRIIEGAAPDSIGGALAVCHGDFVCSQILVADSGWSVTDFDLCHLGDPYRDIAIFLASLAYDVPLLAQGSALVDRAAAAYLAGYARRAGAPLDLRRLTCHRVCAEIYYLALMLKKDRYDAVAFAHRLVSASRLARELAETEQPT